MKERTSVRWPPAIYWNARMVWGVRNRGWRYAAKLAAAKTIWPFVKRSKRGCEYAMNLSGAVIIDPRPLRPAVLERLGAHVERMERATEAAAEKRRQEIESSGEHAHLVIVPGAGGEDAEDFAEKLGQMYHLWATRHNLEVRRHPDGLTIRGPGASRLKREAGVHRMCRMSPFDEQGRRHTSFATVIVDGRKKDDQLRSYILDPYTKVVDHKTKVEIEDAPAVLRGALDPFLEVA